MMGDEGGETVGTIGRSDNPKRCACGACSSGRKSLALRDQDNAIGRVCQIVAGVQLFGIAANLIATLRTSTRGQAIDMQKKVVDEIAGAADDGIPDDLDAWIPSDIRRLLTMLSDTLQRSIVQADERGLFNDDPSVWLDDDRKKFAGQVPVERPSPVASET